VLGVPLLHEDEVAYLKETTPKNYLFDDELQ
jgi:hypothetical protein